MSEQALSLDEWSKVREAFRNHFNDQNIEVQDEKCRYSRNGEHLAIQKDGEVSGAMPLHENKFSQAEKVIFRDSEIEIKSENSAYKFRR